MKEMNLKDFVSGVIAEIMDGIVEAQAHAKSVGGRVNPILSGRPEPGFYFFHEPTGESHYGQLVAFDVAVSTGESEQAKGGIGLFAGAVGLGTQAKLEGSRSDAARISFAVPVIFPIQK
jgi:hypothetical protein